METVKKSVLNIEGERYWNVTYHKEGELVASSAWFGTEQEVDDFIATLEKGQK